MAPETPKGVSSRLLSMKFMQRAAASSANSTPESDAPSSKKRKISHSDEKFNAQFDQAAVQAAIDEREAKRLAALEKHGANDTQWVLKTNLSKEQDRTKKQPLKVVYVGYGDIDSSDDEETGKISQAGRTSTSNYKPSKISKSGKEEVTNPDKNSSDEDDDDDDSGEDSERQSNTDSPVPKKAQSRSRSNSRQTTESTKAAEFRNKRRKKEVHINKITSISSAGANNQFGSPGSQGIKCYTCQQTGHKASDCPRARGSKNSKR